MNKKFTFIILTVFFVVMGLAIVAFNGGMTYANGQEKFEMMSFEEAITTPDGLNLRCGPSLRYPVSTILTKGEKINVLGRIGDWYAVYEPLNAYGGFVYGKYLNIKNENTPQVVITPTITPSPTPEATESPKPQEQIVVTADEQKLLDLVNQKRQEQGLNKLVFDSKLRKCATEKAKDMVRNNYFAHESPTYGSPFDMMRHFGISFKSAGENIAGNQSVEGAFNAWMNSTGHRENILNKNFNYVGFGIVESQVYGKILVQQFIGV